MPKTKNVLIAEDDHLLGTLLKETLEAHDAHVTIAKNGADALKIVAKDDVDLLLLDLLMPGTDGFAVLEKIHTDHKKLPVVIISNLSDNRSRERCKSLGCKAYLVKSDLDDEDVWPAVKKYLV
jgi:CheY-like chemotaxis protein